MHGNREDTLDTGRRSEHGERGIPIGPSSVPLRPDQRKFRAVAASLCLALLVGVGLLPFGSPAPLLSLQTCVFKGATGLPCPLCGGTRAAQAMLRGDIARATYLNIAAVPTVAALVALAILLVFEAARGRALINWKVLLLKVRPLLPFLAVLFCAYWAAHLAGAVRGLKSELVDLRNPIAQAICQRFSKQGK